MGRRLCCFRGPEPSGKNKNIFGTSNNGDADLYSALKNVRVFSYNQLKSATRNFHPDNKIGRGGFGVVYKGTLRDGTLVAIKSLSTESKQGRKEFLTEIDTISNVRHPNLVQLIGCCVEGNNRMLIYEYLENNSLAIALFGPKKMQISLDWSKRASICIGTARGISFLHEEAEPRIVHRDIKASNVLLDRDLIPKIGDFGLAKLFPDTATHISTRVAGTMGYLAPEYALLGQLTRKADIYSFGVLILVVISGRSANKSAWGPDLRSLLEWTWSLREEEERLLDIVDSELVGYPEGEVLCFIKVALLCTQAVSSQRPSMGQVVEMLQSDGSSIDVKSLTQPGTVREIDRSSEYPGSSSGLSKLHKGHQQTDTYAFITSTKNINSSMQASTSEVEPR
ncbi:putative serine/threonine-protein kinase isoform X2 [Iris pallida]|uniref:Serine/threonine-protein kinase isoform X2 n=1 Tax=Iris pallida TaxID=29817 RepID=A0AAX6HH18_IRIPA|nr:putative serine/threonine-protein kinase isoform X2 [Iris pallida]